MSATKQIGFIIAQHPLLSRLNSLLKNYHNHHRKPLKDHNPRRKCFGHIYFFGLKRIKTHERDRKSQKKDQNASVTVSPLNSAKQLSHASPYSGVLALVHINLFSILFKLMQKSWIPGSATGIFYIVFIQNADEILYG